jgi:hypothetical protein
MTSFVGVIEPAKHDHDLGGADLPRERRFDAHATRIRRRDIRRAQVDVEEVLGVAEILEQTRVVIVRVPRMTHEDAIGLVLGHGSALSLQPARTSAVSLATRPRHAGWARDRCRRLATDTGRVPIVSTIMNRMRFM